MDLLRPILTSGGVSLVAVDPTTTADILATTTTDAKPTTTTAAPTTTTTAPPTTTSDIPTTTTPNPPPTTTTPNPSTTTTTVAPSTTTTSAPPTTSIPVTSDHVSTTSAPIRTPSFSTSFSLISITSNNQVIVSTTAIIATITPSPAGEDIGTQVSTGPNAAVIGGAVGGVVVFAALIIAAWVLWIRRKRRQNGSGKAADFFDDEDMSYERMYAPSPPPFASPSKRISMATPSEGSHGYRDSISSNRMSTNFDEMLDPRPLLMAEHGLSTPSSTTSIKDPLSVRQNQRLRVLVGSGGSVIPSSSTSSSDEHKPDAAHNSPDDL